MSALEALPEEPEKVDRADVWARRCQHVYGSGARCSNSRAEGQEGCGAPGHAAPGRQAPPIDADRLVGGGSFLLDIPDETPAVWGDGKQVVWAEGESVLLAGPAGVGKTTIAGQVVEARCFGGVVLGLPVTQTASKVLYLAMDRPQQIARALKRTMGSRSRADLDARLVVWKGPPLEDIAKNPKHLLALAQKAGADTIFIDSLKDAAIGLTEDEVGAGYNSARQTALANGVEVFELHHMVKRGENGSAPNKLADVYGSVWIGAGAGSVVSIHGEGGDLIVDWRHLKQPSEEVGPFQVEHDHAAGTSRRYDVIDLLEVATREGSLTARDGAELMFGDAKAKNVAKVRRFLDAHVRAGRLVSVPGETTNHPTVWKPPTASDVFSEMPDFL